MEVYFLDVGMGTCQIILLGNRKAIVIDCGVRSDYIALHFLEKYGIDRVVRLITSHSDNDHTGGAITVLDNYQDRIDEVHIIQDSRFLATDYWRRIDYLNEQGTLLDSQIKRLEIPQQKPKILWQEGSSKLSLLSPDFLENQRAQASSSTNATSAVLVLEHMGSTVVFAADSVITQWRKIYERRNHKTLTCDLLSVPHHGGHMGDQPGDLDWLYQTALKPNVSIVSVGTRQNPKHPRPEVIKALVDASSTVMCTQISKQCHADLRAISSSVLTPLTLLGRTQDNIGKARPQSCVGCSGTVMATLNASGCKVDRLAEHQRAVNEMNKSTKATPLCRP